MARRRKPKSRAPETPAEWQAAVDGAEFLLLVDSARQYGLIEGGPVVNCDRAAELLERGRALGYTPASRDELIRRYITEQGAI